MERITVTFYKEVCQKLKNRSQKKGEIPVAQSIRELVDVGFRVEDAAEKNESDGAGNDLMEMLSEIKSLIKQNLSWSLESRLLQRLSIEKNSLIDKDESTIKPFLPKQLDQVDYLKK